MKLDIIRIFIYPPLSLIIGNFNMSWKRETSMFQENSYSIISISYVGEVERAKKYLRLTERGGV